VKVTGATVEGINRNAKTADAKAQAALQNEQVTRQRVELLEKAVATQAGILARPFWGRLSWLLRGR
jgi:hypothetical protein